MANYNNAAYTYAQVLAGTGYYMKDDLLRYSEGVKTMQTKLNAAGYNCGTPDGKFGTGTNIAVRSFQSAKGLTVDGKAGKNTLKAHVPSCIITSFLQIHLRMRHGAVRQHIGLIT